MNWPRFGDCYFFSDPVYLRTVSEEREIPYETICVTQECVFIYMRVRVSLCAYVSIFEFQTCKGRGWYLQYRSILPCTLSHSLSLFLPLPLSTSLGKSPSPILKHGFFSRWWGTLTMFFQVRTLFYIQWATSEYDCICGCVSVQTCGVLDICICRSWTIIERLYSLIIEARLFLFRSPSLLFSATSLYFAL